MQNYLLEITDVLSKRVVICAETIGEAIEFARTDNVVLDDSKDISGRLVSKIGKTGKALRSDIEKYGVMNVTDFKEENKSSVE